MRDVVGYGVLAFVVCALVGLMVQLHRGDTAFGTMRGRSPETRRAVRRAIREGETGDADVDRLARRAMKGTATARWTTYLFGALLALSVLLLVVGPHTPGQLALRSAHALLWAGLIALNVVNRRRLDSYRGLRPAPDNSRVEG